ncbi:hypothetical protein Trydic_g15946, partial [Trypoxylus dichotomus]
SSKKNIGETGGGVLIKEEVKPDLSTSNRAPTGAHRKAQISNRRDLFDDDTDDDDLFSTTRNSRKSENDLLNSKVADLKTPNIAGANHPSRSIRSMDFGLSDDEDIFNAKKTRSKKPDIIKRLPFDDDEDDDDDLFGSASKGKQQ